MQTNYLYRAGVAITPSDTAAVQFNGGIYVGVTGDVTLIDSAGTTLLFKGVPAGVTIPLHSIQTVKATGTTATNLIGLLL